MSHDKNVRILSAQEVEEIMALPDRRFIIAGLERKGKFNENTGIFYILNDDGTLNGRIAKTTRKDRPPDEATLAVKDSGTADASNGESTKHFNFSLSKTLHKLAGDADCGDDSNTMDDSETSSTDNPKKKKIFVPIISGLAIVSLLLIFALSKAVGPTPQNDENLSGPSLETIDVIQVTRDLIPGDFISEDNIQRASISAETYNQIYLDSSQLYQWSRYEALTGNQVITYIPCGQYLTYDNVASVYLQPANPWLNESEDMSYVTIPLKEDILANDNFSYGSVVNLIITKQTVKEINQTEEDTEQDASTVNIPGLDHQMSIQQSYVVDTYGMSDITICDLLNSKQESLYSTYTSWICIPTGERLTYIRNRLNDDRQLTDSLTPAYAIIRISNEQAAELGDLTGDNISISFIDQDVIDTETETKAAYTAEVRALQHTITEAATLNEKASEETFDE